MLNEEESKILSMIKANDSYRKYFFQNIKNKKWFMVLKDEGYFKKENAPTIVKNEKGYYFPYCHVLDYLVKVSKLIKEKTIENESIIT